MGLLVQHTNSLHPVPCRLIITPGNTHEDLNHVLNGPPGHPEALSYLIRQEEGRQVLHAKGNQCPLHRLSLYYLAYVVWHAQSPLPPQPSQAALPAPE